MKYLVIRQQCKGRPLLRLRYTLLLLTPRPFYPREGPGARRTGGFVCPRSSIIIIILLLLLFINCNWVVTRWQRLFYMYTKYEIGY